MKKIFGFIMICCMLHQVKSQTNLVTPDSILYSCHKQHQDSIVFMPLIIPIESFTDADWQDTIVLQPESDLHIRVFMRNSLTNYLHLLAPELSSAELTSRGNYQFTFYVDQQKVYTENIPVGAGSAESKNSRTVFRIPLISHANEDSWGRFLWQRFMMQGGADVLTAGAHLLTIEIRPYLQTQTVLVGDIIAAGACVLVVPDIVIDSKLVQLQKIKKGSGWPVATDKIDTAKLELLNSKIVGEQFKNISSIIIIKNGKLLVESYYHGANRSTLHDTRSVGKTIAGALTGAAIYDGYITNESTTLQQYYHLSGFRNYTSQKDTISIKSLLTMQSVFAGSDNDASSPGNEEKMYPTNNWVQFALDLPLDALKLQQPHWDYFTGGVVILGDILNKAVPNGLVQYCDEQLFAPMDIKKYQWEYTPQKIGNTAGGLRMRSLDLAKIGLLYQNKGNWNGNQIFSSEWAEKSLSQQSKVEEGKYYGYLLWNTTYLVDNMAYEVYYASGNGGNKIFIFKDYPVVIVITATAYNQGFAHVQVDKMMEQYLIPALLLH